MSRLNMIMNNEKKIPIVKFTIVRSGGYLIFKGTFYDFINKRNYFGVIEHGILYARETEKNNIGAENFTCEYLENNTTSVTKRIFTSFTNDGIFSYKYMPSGSKVKYSARAYLKYKDKQGILHYVYSNISTQNVRGY